MGRIPKVEKEKALLILKNTQGKTRAMMGQEGDIHLLFFVFEAETIDDVSDESALMLTSSGNQSSLSAASRGGRHINTSLDDASETPTPLDSDSNYSDDDFDKDCFARNGEYCASMPPDTLFLGSTNGKCCENCPALCKPFNTSGEKTAREPAESNDFIMRTPINSLGGVGMVGCRDIEEVIDFYSMHTIRANKQLQSTFAEPLLSPPSVSTCVIRRNGTQLGAGYQLVVYPM